MDLSNAIGSRSGLTGTQCHTSIFSNNITSTVTINQKIYLLFHTSVFMYFLYLFIHPFSIMFLIG